MAENFYTILTSTGKAKLANSAVLGSKVNFKTLKVGDGKGSYYEPSENQTSLVNQVWSGNIGSISVDENNPNWIVIETLIPATIGGFFIREAGIFDEDDDLIAISKLSETYKPVVSEGSIKDLCIKIILEVSNVERVTLKIDPTVIVATKKDIQVIEVEVKDVNARLLKLSNDISNEIITVPKVTYGMNSVIKNNSKVTAIPKFTIQGKTLVNLIGKDGNCEDVSRWGDYQCTHALDTTNKVFGTNGIKITLTNTTGQIAGSTITSLLTIGKYYCISAYLKNGNATNIKIMIGGRGFSSIGISDTTKFNRDLVKFQSTGTETSAVINVTGTSGQYAYVDGIMLEEITQAQYNDSNFTPSPYVDSYACLTNPYIEVRHNNLVRNGNGEEGAAWWNLYGSHSLFTRENGYFKVTDNDTTYNEGVFQIVEAKPNTTYTARVVLKCGNLAHSKLALVEVIDNVDNQANRQDIITTSTTDTILTAQITTGSRGTALDVRLVGDPINSSETGTFFFKEVILVEGTILPPLYLPCRIERCVLETKLTSDDIIIYENGKVSGELWWKHKTLFGKDYDWLPGGNFKEYKKIYTSIPVPTYDGVYFSNYSNGRVLEKYNQSMGQDYGSNVIYTNGSNFEFGAPNSDTGWQESISPNSDEVKAYMNGWRSCNNSGIRYTAWNSIPKIGIDACANNTDIDAFPLGSATTLSAATNGTTIIVNNSNIFRVGDSIAVKPNAVTTVAAISGNTITLATSQILQQAGNVVFRLDNGTTDTRILNYCANNVAPGYEGYKIHYKLKNPEYVTDANVCIHGDIPKYDSGDNYVYLDSGYVLGEVVNPTYHNASDYQYKINSMYYDNKTESYLENKTECLFNILKNNLQDDNNWFIKSNDFAANGRAGAYITSANYDSNAVYSVDYKILSTITPTIGTISCSYTEDIISAINDLYEEVNSRQTKDDMLDELVDKSMYEDLMTIATAPYYARGGNVFGVYQTPLYIPMIPKKAIPIINANIITVSCFDANGVRNEIPLGDISYDYYFLNNALMVFRVWYLGSNSTIKTNFISYPVRIIFSKLTADCRGRL